jgi:mannose-6-phosphate isomerase-like protein (cupin superfamily)
MRKRTATSIVAVAATAMVSFGQGSTLASDGRDAGAILQSYVVDFRQDPAAAQPITFGIRVTGDGGGEWHVVAAGKKRDGSGESDVALHPGFPKEPCAFYTLDLLTLRKIDQGTWNALTAMGRARASDPAPMDIGLTEGFRPDAKFFETFVPLSFHFWTRGWPERVQYGPATTRILHGANATMLYYQKGLRSAWFQIAKGQHANRDPREQVTPFPTMVIGLRGRCEARIGGKSVTLDQKEMLFIPAGVSHEFWNPYDEPAEAVLIMFGEGA